MHHSCRVPASRPGFVALFLLATVGVWAQYYVQIPELPLTLPEVEPVAIFGIGDGEGEFAPSGYKSNVTPEIAIAGDETLFIVDGPNGRVQAFDLYTFEFLGSYETGFWATRIRSSDELVLAWDRLSFPDDDEGLPLWHAVRTDAGWRAGVTRMPPGFVATYIPFGTFAVGRSGYYGGMFGVRYVQAENALQIVEPDEFFGMIERGNAEIAAFDFEFDGLYLSSGDLTVAPTPEVARRRRLTTNHWTITNWEGNLPESSLRPRPPVLAGYDRYGNHYYRCEPFVAVFRPDGETLAVVDVRPGHGISFRGTVDSVGNYYWMTFDDGTGYTLYRARNTWWPQE